MRKSPVKTPKRIRSSSQISLPFGAEGLFKKQGQKPHPALLPGDWRLLVPVLILCLFGLVMIYNASSLLAERSHHDSFYFIKKQLQWSLIGLIAFVAASRVEIGRLRAWIIPMAALVFLLLTSVLLFGAEINGARRWIGIGPFTLQPSEMAKLFTVLYLAHYIAKKEDRLKSFLDGTAPPLVVIGLMSLLILVEPDLGTTVVILSLTLSLLFLGGMPITQLLSLLGMIVPFLTYWIVSSPYRLERILTFLNPWKEPFGSGFQVIQSQIALGSGGLTGTGLAEGKQILFFLPEPHTDFIFAVIGETFGLLGTLFVLALFSAILWRGGRTALLIETPFHRLLAIGMTLVMTLPALLNMGVVTGLLPTKGLPLPFLSYGGSSLLANSIALGLLYNLSREVCGRSFWKTEKASSLWEGLR